MRLSSKRWITLAALGGLLVLAERVQAQSQGLNFQANTYFTAAGNVLTSSGQTLAGFDYSSAPATHPLLTDGIYFPVVDYQNRNLWVRVRHTAADPNGTATGHYVTGTLGSPFRSDGFGGWFGFQYQLDIYRDTVQTGPPGNVLNGLYPTNITVESIETLSQPEWVSFEILNPQASDWTLNSINFTGQNPNSTPGFSAVNIPWPGVVPPTGFSPTFPAASRNVYVVDYVSSSYAEFRMSADRVSQFSYGYEYDSPGGYQGMRLYFGIPSATGVRPETTALGLRVFPTLTEDGAVAVAFDLPARAATIGVTNALGQLVLTQPLPPTSGTQPVRISLAGQPAGLYFLTLHAGGRQATTRVLKAR